MDRHQRRLAYASEIQSPSWTWGFSRTQRQRDQIENESAAGVIDDGLSGTSLFARQRWLKGIVALFQGAGVALLFPLFIVALLVALAFRFVLELTGWRIVGLRQE